MDYDSLSKKLTSTILRKIIIIIIMIIDHQEVLALLTHPYI